MNQDKINEVVGEILRIKDKLGLSLTKWQAPELLEAMFELASYKVTLGSIVAQVELEYNQAYNLRKVESAQGIRRLVVDLPVSKAEVQVDAESREVREAEAQAQYQLTMLKNLYRDTEMMVTVLQSKLRYLTTDRMQDSRTPSVN